MTEHQHPLESVSSMRRRRFLGLAAFAGTSVIGVGVTGIEAQAAAAEQPGQQTYTIDKDTGWPIFSGDKPPSGYERHYLPCDHGQYVDVPVEKVTHSLEGVTLIHPPYRHEDWHRIPGGKQ